ncbi:MAG: hypothetical protein H7A23_11065 [Leptospiraceae bacterium]|nr:hypothetical protein [Leptospiraceae bacterium]MCP5495084.1 hypothetical protein [Leptospiraceae bacterium]
MYTGGGDTISGKEAKQKIEAKVMYMAWSGYTIAESSKNLDNFSCVVSPSANLIIDIENNDYTYKAQTINVPTKEKPSIRIQGKIEDDTDQDYYYMYVPSDTNNVTLYFRETGSPDVGCYLYTDNSSYQYFSNNWSKLPLSRSSYVYIKCYKGSETGFYDMEITINKQDTSNSSDSDTKRSYYLGRLMEPYFFKFTNKIENHKYYTRHSLNRCLSRLNLVILATGFLDTWNYHYSLKCDSTYTPLNPYLSAALSCTLDEADFIQIGK